MHAPIKPSQARQEKGTRRPGSSAATWRPGSQRESGLDLVADQPAADNSVQDHWHHRHQSRASSCRTAGVTGINWRHRHQSRASSCRTAGVTGINLQKS